MSRPVKISEKWVELLEETADQLDTTMKGVVDAILEWFFEGGWKTDEGPGLLEELDEEEAEELIEELDEEEEIIEE